MFEIYKYLKIYINIDHKKYRRQLIFEIESYFLKKCFIIQECFFEGAKWYIAFYK